MMQKIIYITILVFQLQIFFAQTNTISVKKKTINKTQSLLGLYCSEEIYKRKQSKSGFVNYKPNRFYIYFINSQDVYIINSTLPPKKVLQKLNNKGVKVVNEYGSYTKSNGDIYITTQRIQTNHSMTYKYVGTTIEGKVHLKYKAVYKGKTALDIYLYKYDSSTNL